MTPSTRFILPAVATAAALVLSGCGSSGFESSEPEDTVYCVNQDNVVVDEDQCGEEGTTGHSTHSGGSSLLLWYMIGKYTAGQRPGAQLDPALASHRVQTTDTAGRTAAGLNATGTVKNGQNAGFGKASTGKSGSHPGKPGGFGGGTGTGG